MPICLRCEGEFPARVLVEGRMRSTAKRRYCLICSPFGGHNTRRLHAEGAESLRVCSICAKQYPAGHGQYVTTCKSCRVVQRRQELKRLAVAHLGGRCQLCGYDRCIAALQFHHLAPGHKDFQVAEYSRSWDRVRAEAEKCALLCANCHAEVHAGLVTLVQGQGPLLLHGTLRNSGQS